MYTSKKCVGCNKEFFKDDKPSRWNKKKYCSIKCYDDSRRGKKMIGERLEKQRRAQLKMISSITPEMRVDMNKRILETRKKGTWFPSMLGKKGEDCPNWLGEDAGYNGKHRWIQQNWKKTGVCEECGCTPTAKGKQFGTHWSNNDHTYNRDRKEWQELCPKCHYKKDKQIYNN